MSKEPLLKLEEYPDYEKWYANISPKEIRAKIGHQIVYVDYVDPYRGTYSPKSAIIADAHRSFIIFENGMNEDKRTIIECIISKEKIPVEE